MKKKLYYSLQRTLPSPYGEGDKKGFTLVEMLVVIAVLSILGVLILNIFTSSLRGSNKSQIIGIIKQNGQSVLEVIDKTVRNADGVICPTDSSPIGTTLVVVKNGSYTRFRFIVPNSPASCSSANGCILEDFPVQPAPPATESDLKLFLNNICTNPPESNVQIITDTNESKGVSIQNGTFSKNKSAGYKDSVTVSFDVGPGTQAPAAVSGQVGTVNFKTTIQLR